ncbi:hypothetical protein MOU_21155 [Xanthomonas citri pv. malvacearum str. GSPB1386]|nr:hypothetical protein MOU_21155 [Xanthomonas citri pv. malvacearum str. GSPB1386]
MKEKYWPDHLAKGYIAIEGAQFEGRQGFV